MNSNARWLLFVIFVLGLSFPAAGDEAEWRLAKDLPPEVLKTSMKEHQKFFSLRAPKTDRIEAFVTVANIEAPDGGKAILEGAKMNLRDGIAYEAKCFGEVCGTKDMRIGVENFLDRHHLLALNRLVVGGLGAVGAVFLAAAGFDRKQCAELHLVIGPSLGMHRLGDI